MTQDPLSQPALEFKSAVEASDAANTRAILARHPELRARINDPLPGQAFGQHALFCAVQRSDRATIDVLLEAGADIDKRTEWWAGGFGVLDECHPELAPFLVERGALLDAHAAARLGLMVQLQELLTADPSVVYARGGDGQTPLHFASTTDIAELLLQHGADPDARDFDHESTPAQYMLRAVNRRHYPADRQEVARYLVAKGCHTDLLLAAALGDAALVRHHLDRDPESIHMEVSEQWFPKANPRSAGTIYIWTIGAHRTAHTAARDFGHEEVFHLLLERTPAALKLALACELGDQQSFEELLRVRPDLSAQLSVHEQLKLPHAAKNSNTEAVRLMLEAGWPVNTRGEMGATALHWAAFHGNAMMTREILRFHPALELKSDEYTSTALEWALHGSGNGWHRETGDYVGTVRLLCDAGALVPEAARSWEVSATLLEELSRPHRSA